MLGPSTSFLASDSEVRDGPEYGRGGTGVRSVARAAATLGISRSSAYQLANEWLDTGGREGLPCVRLRRRILVPLAVIAQWAAEGSDRSQFGSA